MLSETGVWEESCGERQKYRRLVEREQLKSKEKEVLLVLLIVTVHVCLQEMVFP